MLVVGRVDKEADTEFVIGLMEHFMRESGKMIKDMDMVG